MASTPSIQPLWCANRRHRLSRSPASAPAVASRSRCLRRRLSCRWRIRITASRSILPRLTMPTRPANQYAYKLEGFDKDWIAAGTRRTATYTNLDGGDYVFRVKAANRAGVWNGGAAVNVHLAVPPWRTWWAYSLYGLALAGVVAGFVRYRTQRQHRLLAAQERLSAQLEMQVVERTAALSLANDALRASKHTPSPMRLAAFTGSVRTC